MFERVTINIDHDPEGVAFFRHGRKARLYYFTVLDEENDAVYGEDRITDKSELFRNIKRCYDESQQVMFIGNAELVREYLSIYGENNND
jgi:hypothetical protein